jgi:hypothetical protein
MTNTPKKIDDSVIDFCKSLSPNSVPKLVNVRPEPWCLQNHCYDNVQKKVEHSGGKRQLGWRIQVVPDPLPKFMIEAVHHAIWISETGERIDITPQPASSHRIVFVSDDSTPLGNYRIGEKYRALIKCPLVHEYVRLCNLESDEYTSKTELKNRPNVPAWLTQKQEKLLPQIIAKHGALQAFFPHSP